MRPTLAFPAGDPLGSPYHLARRVDRGIRELQPTLFQFDA